jgi:hypothetical protein
LKESNLVQKQKVRHQDEDGEQEIVRRRDEAVRRALNTPPTTYEKAKVGKQKPKTSSASAKP